MISWHRQKSSRGYRLCIKWAGIIPLTALLKFRKWELNPTTEAKWEKETKWSKKCLN